MENKLTFNIETDELEIFLQDVNEHLDAMEAGILQLEQAAPGVAVDPDTLNATFRAAHTIKAVAATVGHTQMAKVTHTLETLFDAMREDGTNPTPTVTDTLLDAVDVLRGLRDEVLTGQHSGIDVAVILARLNTLASNVDSQQDTGLSEGTQPLLTEEQAVQVKQYREQGLTVVEIKATARADAFATSARLLQATLALAQVGQVITQQPSQTELTETTSCGHLWLILATQTETGRIEEILSAISDLAQFRVQPYGLDTGSPNPKPTQPASQLSDQTIRISVERLDTLMNLVGELVTDRTRLTQVQGLLRVQYGRDAKNGAISALGNMVTHFERVVDQLQEEVMQARMLPIDHLFHKFPRLVRDVARTGGKQVNLIIEGEATELDRSVIEVIGDPLIHLLRNAVDHGIESPQDRVEAGKPPTGTVWLTAAHEEGHIVITVKDDGRGIDPQRIRRSAVSRRLLSEEKVAQLDDDAAINLIFQPNLSTAEQVTDVSGRGVGMDVVLTNVKRLSGSVTVESKVGQTTSFRVTLPLTLAIVQAMMVGLGSDVYAIPLSSIIESLYLSDADISSVKSRPVIQWRDQVLPVVYLRELYAIPEETDLFEKNLASGRPAVVTVAWGRLKAGLIVDRLLGKQEIVIKSIGHFIGNVPGLSGCTILGDGRIALIADIPGLISTMMKQNRALTVTGP